jgi:hypothetical protein
MMSYEAVYEEEEAVISVNFEGVSWAALSGRNDSPSTRGISLMRQVTWANSEEP